MQAIILAGGFGTRLQSVVKDIPKPMADINGKPFLHHLISYLKSFGFTDIVLSTQYLQEKISKYFGNNYLGINIKYAIENEPLGTGGAIINSLKYIDNTKPVVILNGDSFLKINYQKLIASHLQKNSDLTIVLRHMDNCSRYGLVVINDEIITDFREKNGEQKSGLINGGIYILNPNLFNNFNLAKIFSFEKDFMAKYLDKLRPNSFISDDYFIDIGIPEDYKKAQIEIPRIIKNKALFLDRDGVINIDHDYVHKIENFDFVSGIFDLGKKAIDLGYLLIVITNQAGIGKGYYSEEQFLELTKWMENQFIKHQIKITKTFYCPYHIDAKIEKYRQNSFDRKPNPGMLLKAIEEFNIDPKNSIMIGDKETDMMAAEKAGIGLKIIFKTKTNLADLEIKNLQEINL